MRSGSRRTHQDRPEDRLPPHEQGSDPDSVGADEAIAESGGGLENELESLHQQLEARTREAKENYDQFLRTAADLDNVRRRLSRENEEVRAFGNQELVRQLLPIVDNFQLALQHSESTREFDTLLQGVRQILKQMQDTLRKAGVEPIEAVGRPFNPDVHEAIGHVASNGHEEGSVVEEVRTGYTLNGRCIRPSLVRVAGD